MRKLNKHSKKAYTLLEMALVIAIIVILAAVIGIAANKYLQTSKSASSKTNSAVSSMKASNSATAQKLKGYGF